MANSLEAVTGGPGVHVPMCDANVVVANR